jgi:hypothetical protein
MYEFWAIWLAGCCVFLPCGKKDYDTDTATDTAADTATDTDTDVSLVSPCPIGTSDLEGVCIAFDVPDVTLTLAEAAAGVHIPYRVVVEQPHDMTPTPQDAGGCGQPGPSGLIVFEDLHADSQRYCECDVGLCAGDPEADTLVVGQFPDEFVWDGRNWSGPSDTGNPEGTPFPVGTYTLEVSAIGESAGAPFRVSNALTVTLVP